MHCNLIEFMGWKARSTWDISLVISLLGDLRLSQGHKLYQFFLGLRVYHHLLLQISHRWFDGNVSGATVGHGGTLVIVISIWLHITYKHPYVHNVNKM